MEGCGLHQSEDSQPSVLGGPTMSPNPELFVVTGGVHAKVAPALQALARIEQEQGRKIAQVFSVGDSGLFISESAWAFFTGPARHKHPDWSPEIRKAWTRCVLPHNLSGLMPHRSCSSTYLRNGRDQIPEACAMARDCLQSLPAATASGYLGSSVCRRKCVTRNPRGKRLWRSANLEKSAGGN